jgi:hypothetical protein
MRWLDNGYNMDVSRDSVGTLDIGSARFGW